MNNWNQNQNNYTSYTPYQQQNMWGAYGAQNMRPPIYKSDPIHGKDAAWAFPIGGGEIWIPDADQDIIWWIRIDQNGNKQVSPFDIKPHEDPQPVDMNDILARLGAVEEWINGKQNKSNAKRSATTSIPANTTESIN